MFETPVSSSAIDAKLELRQTLRRSPDTASRQDVPDNLGDRELPQVAAVLIGIVENVQRNRSSRVAIRPPQPAEI